MDFLSLVKVGFQGPLDLFLSFASIWGLQWSLDLISLSYSSNWGIQGSLDLISLSYLSNWGLRGSLHPPIPLLYFFLSPTSQK